MVAIYLIHLCSVSFVRSTPPVKLTLERAFVRNTLLSVFPFYNLLRPSLFGGAAAKPAFVKSKPHEEYECCE